MANLTIAERVKERRQSLGKSQETLARDSRVSLSMIIRLERGRLPKLASLRRIADALALPVSDLMPDDDHRDRAAN